MSNRPKQLYFFLAIIFILILVSSFTFFRNLEGYQEISKESVTKTVYEKPEIKDSTIIDQEIIYLCGDRMVTRIPTTKDLVGIDYEGLLKNFSPEDGWTIDDSTSNMLTLSRVENDICPLHQNYFHLGIHQGKLAVYFGPLGYDEKLLKVENVSVENLPQELQEALESAKNFGKETLAKKSELKRSLEFPSEKNLNDAILKLWDELDEALG